MELDEDTSYAEWSARDNFAGSNQCWLPAYGFQQPGDQDGQTQFLFLETILEETSDDLLSDTSGSWLDSASDDAQSVIHVSQNGDDPPDSWSGSERDLAVPSKRRRQDDDVLSLGDLQADVPQVIRRSASLIAFESLEKRCEEDTFRLLPFQLPKGLPDVGRLPDAGRLSDVDADAEDEDDSESSASDDALMQSLSSRGSFRSSGGSDRLRSFRSLDSLSSPGPTTGAQLPASLSRPCQDLSMGENGNASDVDDVDHVPRRTTRSHSLSPRLGRDSQDDPLSLSDREELARDARVTRPALPPPPPPPTAPAPKTIQRPTVPPPPPPGKVQRSAENLSEDSGFGEHILNGRTPGVCPILEDEDSSCYSDCSSGGAAPETALEASVEQNSEILTDGLNIDEGHPEWGITAKYNDVCWARSAPDLLSVRQPSPSPADAIAMASTPNLALQDDAEERSADDPYRPLNHKSELNKMLSGSRGVHFCPVVSEVSWRESYSESDSDVDEEVAEEPAAPAAARPKMPPPPPPPSQPPQQPQQPQPPQQLQLSPSHRSEVSATTRTASAIPPTAIPPRPASAPAPKPTATPVVTMASPQPVMATTPATKKRSRLGGFFQKFSLRRLGGRVADNALPKKPVQNNQIEKRQQGTNSTAATAPEEDVRIIPLHPTPEELEAERREEARRTAEVVVSKPPLPPGAAPSTPLRRLPPEHAPYDILTAAATAAVAASVAGSWRSSSSMAGLLETDLDADLPPPPPPRGAKARSLLDVSSGVPSRPSNHTPHLHPRDHSPTDNSRAKSMEFLLDKRNQEAVQPPENALQGRVLSEHELRVQRSLQRLNVPDWYKNSPKPADGFLLRRSERRWPGLGTKTTSLSSLGSAPSTGLRSPTARLGASPSPPPNVFSRWSSTRIHSAEATPSISPCGSARSSFNHRQPYLGWRSQERLTSPRTPAERLAAGLLPAVRAKQQQQQQQQDDVDRLQAQSQASPNLSEVRTSIKEVTSAIVHYVSGHGAGANDLGNSPRGSTNRLCWLESSFVGTRPVESPETPVQLRSVTPQQDLYLDLHKQQHRNELESSPVGTPVETPVETPVGTPVRRYSLTDISPRKAKKRKVKSRRLQSLSLEVVIGVGVCLI